MPQSGKKSGTAEISLNPHIMFSTRERLAKKTPNNGIDRESYIQLLAEEYYETTDLGKKMC